MSAPAILELHELTRKFGAFTAVDRLSLTIERSEVFGLLGPNGAGKSTTIKMLTTLLHPTSGKASIGGFDIERSAPEVRRLIGYVPQALSADGSLTGRENLIVFARLYDLPRKEHASRIAAALDLVGLAEAADKMVNTFSGGMIRRLEIAQATLHQPQLLFLDEPTIGLDPLAREVVWEHIEKLRAELQMTVFLTTHYMEEADAHCSRIAIMHRAQVAAIGTPDELKATITRRDASEPEVTLDDVFSAVAGDGLDSGGSFKQARDSRQVARRLG